MEEMQADEQNIHDTLKHKQPDTETHNIQIHY